MIIIMVESTDETETNAYHRLVRLLSKFVDFNISLHRVTISPAHNYPKGVPRMVTSQGFQTHRKEMNI